MFVKNVEEGGHFIIISAVQGGAVTMYSLVDKSEALIYDGDKMIKGIVAREWVSRKQVAFPAETEVALVV